MLNTIVSHVREELAKSPRSLIVLVGPTAVGKTELSISLAQEIGAEIISGDATQFYRGMDVATDKIKEEDMKGVVHHLIDVCDPMEAYTVFDYQQAANDLIEAIFSRANIPMIVGGSMLYIDAVAKGYDFSSGDRRDPSFDVVWVGLTRPREELYARINTRVLREISEGLLEEAEHFHREGLDPMLPSMRALGYKQTIPYFNGEVDYDQMVWNLQRDTRHFCKRQMTWWRANSEILWFDLSKKEVARSLA